MDDDDPSIRIQLSFDSLPVAADLDWAGFKESTKRLLKRKACTQNWVVGLHVCDDKVMSQLHFKYMGECGPTDVMAFADGEGDYLGDVVVCWDEAERQAQTFSHNTVDELFFYILHGCLHLLGEEDHTPEGKKHMLELQADALKSMDRLVEIGL